MTNPVTITVPDGVPFITITREFDAPVDAVFRAYRDPELVVQWLGPNGYDMKLDTYDFSTGGRYRYVHTDPEGATFAFNGVFHVVRENDFVIQTFEYEDVPDVVSIESITFVDLGDGRTRIEGQSTFPSIEARDGMAQSGMEKGVTEGYERLDTLLS
ncbi:SRPBCC family protein [Rhodococcus sp. BP-252]|uniref:Polyketide cyclase n=1 Tax=Rhodococcoides kyotonense TaxID=398843 RepID=A0A177YLP1_9NOCA|nr:MULTISPECIES: SRPBCC family protein [Rhodococcus]MBY6414235.1 SRPBCC family protein [Rhodococcus sp. BP-320]MBY6419005.1 SRPBCC family protein [Rhodococcus sp. BP-321]MBY6423114.1 SRPBCC family protein [Rhodococcus sp. BP-324]MBY6429039.1 SRPBCC family protein [Rhodococcus sp. BP-323]MBY6434045.1 SRPBCC family protein [Rhodococcus sp. BP-322]